MSAHQLRCALLAPTKKETKAAKTIECLTLTTSNIIFGPGGFKLATSFTKKSFQMLPLIAISFSPGTYSGLKFDAFNSLFEKQF